MSGISNGYSTNGTNYTTLWDAYVPVSKPNLSWYAGLCSNQINTGYTTSYTNYVTPACKNMCTGPLDLTSYLDGEHALFQIVDGTAKLPSTAQNWTFQWTAPACELSKSDQFSSKYEPDRPDYLSDDLAILNVRYCLARTQEPVCKVGLMNALLVVTTVCLIVKTGLCILVLSKISDNPLVTVGDAIDSFIIRTDPATLASCTMSGWNTSLVPGPRQWNKKQRCMASAVPIWAWVRTYLLLAVILGIVTALMAMTLDAEHFSG